MTTQTVTQFNTLRDTAYVDRIAIDRAWKEQLEAVNAWEYRAERNYPKDLIEAAWDEVEARTANAMHLEELYREQIEQEVC